MSDIVTITLEQLREQLFEIRGATMFTMISRTNPQLVGGKKCPLVGLEKISRTNGVINWNYENAVNNQRFREADEGDTPDEFVAEPRKWGSRLHDAVRLANGKPRLVPLVAYDWDSGIITAEQLAEIPVDELYLECKMEKSYDHQFFLNGLEVPAEEAYKHIRQGKPPLRQEVEKFIILRDYKLTSIVEISYGKKTYRIAA